MSLPPIIAAALAPPSKDWYRSKSLWLGVLLTLIGISTYFGDPLHTPTMTVASLSEAVGGVVAIVLRVWFTNVAISGTPAAEASPPH